MAINWDLYSTRLKIDGNTFKERQINSMVNAINGSFESNPSYFEVSINGNSTLTGVQIVDNSSNESSKIDYIRKIIMKPTDSISVGDIVDWDSKKWLVVTAEKFSDIYWYGMMQECNNTLRFYNKTGILFTVPCIFTDISIDLHEGRLLDLPIGHYKVVIPSGYITKDDMNLRFCLNDSAYKIEGISTATNGLTKIELEDDQFTPDDNRELGICNYWRNQVIREITILNGTYIKKFSGDEPFQLNVQCKANGIVVDNPTVTYESEDELVCTVSEDGLVTLVGTGIADIIVTFVNVTATVTIESNMMSQDNYNIVLTPSNTELKTYRSITYNAMVTNNGADDPIKQVGFVVTNLDGSTNQYVTYTISGNSISITVGSIYNKSINLKVYMLAYPDVYINRKIDIVSLI